MRKWCWILSISWVLVVGVEVREAEAGLHWWQQDVALGGVVGTWSGIPLVGLRGVLPMGDQLGLRLGWTMLFDFSEKLSFSYSKLSLDLLIRLPSPIQTVRYYGLTRLDFWPLLDVFRVNPKVKGISEKPTFGFSMLLGAEGALIDGLSLFLEAGFSSGMLLGFAAIEPRYQRFCFVLQVGMQFYF